MNETIPHQSVFVTLVRSPQECSRARTLIASLRRFGGEMSRCPVWLFQADPVRASCDDLAIYDVQLFPLEASETALGYLLGDKVSACAQAEEMAGPDVSSLIWIDPGCLVINPPRLFTLGSECDAALRPVHIRNVGLEAGLPLDAYWSGIYRELGIGDIATIVESFVDRVRLRAYFNTHAFAVNPARGWMRQWLAYFEALAGDADFQASACQDELHHIFLHQAVLSALIAARLDERRLRILPPDYSYPYNLHGSLPPDRRARSLNELVCIAYEERPLHPDLVDDIEIHEPLRSWLREQSV